MLSRDLFREIPPAFLRLLGAPGAPIYIDAADALENEVSLRTGPLPREEAIAIVEQVLNRHGESEIEETVDIPSRDRGRILIDRLLAAGWLFADDHADYQRFILLEPNLALLLETLRKIARPDAVVFSDALVATCNALKNTAALISEPWQTIQKCISDTKLGERELRAVSKSVESHTKRQLSAQTLRQNLSVVFDEYAPNVSEGAYAELVRSRLPTRLPEAREDVERLQLNADLIEKMATEVARREDCEFATATARVRNRLHELAQALDRIVPAADEVDRRTADFTRKSLARFRYLQEVTGEHRAIVQAFFERLNSRFAGLRIQDAEAEITELPALLITDVKLPGGLETLHTPRLRHALGEIEPIDEEADVEAKERIQRQLASVLRDSLTISRANRFADDAFKKLGTHIESDKLLSSDKERDWQVTMDELSDVVACLLHAGARDARYRIEVLRGTNFEISDLQSDERIKDTVLGNVQIERFALIKK